MFKKSYLSLLMAAIALCFSAPLLADGDTQAAYTPSATTMGRRLAKLRERNKQKLNEITETILQTAKDTRLKWEYENFDFSFSHVGNSSSNSPNNWQVQSCVLHDANNAGNNANMGMDGPSYGGPDNNSQDNSRSTALANGSAKYYSTDVLAALISETVTKKYGMGKSLAERLAEASELFAKVDIRNKMELQEQANKLPEIQEKFINCYETNYALQNVDYEEAERIRTLIEQREATELAQLQFRNMNSDWANWPVKLSELNNPEWRVHFKFAPLTPELLNKAELLVADLVYPLYKENTNVQISFAPTERVARRTYAGAYKRIGRFKLSIGKDILGMDDLPEILRARFDVNLNRIAKEKLLNKHPLVTERKNAMEDAIKEKVDEMLLGQFEQNLNQGWVYVDGTWKLPEDLVPDVIAYRAANTWYLQPPRGDLRSLNGPDLYKYAMDHEDINISTSNNGMMR